MLGELARGIVLFEPFRNPMTPRELTSCVLKAVDQTAQRARGARRAKEKQYPTMLCVITPTLSADLMAEAETTLLSAEKPGVYRLARVWRTIIVIADKLAEDASTMWLRLLGRGQVQARAVQDLLDAWLRAATTTPSVKALLASSAPPPVRNR